MTSEQVDSEIKAIKQRLYDNDLTAAADAEQLVERHPDQPKVWQLVSFARGKNDDYAGASAAMTRMMGLVPPTPAMFFFRGRYELEQGNFPPAFADFSNGIVRSEELGDPYYLSELIFHRAEVLLALGRKSEARADLANLPDGYSSWTTTLRSKEEMLSECD